VSSKMRRTPAFWNILTQRNLINHVVGWFASHPAEIISGVCVSEAFTRPPHKEGVDWPVPRYSVTPASWADKLGEIRVRCEDIDQALLPLFLPEVDKMDLTRDRRWEKIIYRLAELYTAHNAAVTLLDSDASWRCLAVYYHFIDWICHDFMQYRPPKQKNISEQDMRFYGSVVDAAYRVQDFLLADLLQHAGPDVTLMVVSDHGFHSDHLRPTQIPDVTAGIANWHRPHGMMVITGPGIKQGATIEGANILDVTPTLLHLFNLPVGKDMDGRALFEIGISETQPHTISSWEDELDDWREQAMDQKSADVAEEDALLQQFIDLGYIEMPSNPHEDMAEMTARETAFNLGISLLDAKLPGEAIPHLWEAHAQAPEAPHYAFHLARALANLKLSSAAVEALEVILDFGENHPDGLRLRAQIAFQLDDFETAASYLNGVASESNSHMGFETVKGFIALRQNKLEDAESAFTKAVERDPDDPIAWLGLARAMLRWENFPEAISAAQRSLRLKRELPLAHLTLGQAWESLSNKEAAAIHYAEALRLEPNLINSRDGLLRLHPNVSEETQEKVIAHLSRARTKSTPVPFHPQDAGFILNQARTAYRKKIAEQRATQTPVAVYDFKKKLAPGSSGKCFFIVSGLPRSGTSMIMQMLAHGGWQPMTDAIRKADEDNPKGYYEWESIKSLAGQPEVIEQAGDSPVKVVSPQLPHLPRQHNYRIVYISRPINEVARSQKAMLARLDKAGSDSSLEDLILALEHHEKNLLSHLRSRTEIQMIEISYHQAISDPQAIACQLRDFFGAERLPNAAEMASAVDADLHRQRIPL
jgi:tetratricopeptide (TPR) repeat protein